MIDKKYELTDKTTQMDGVTLYRIRALRSFGDVTEGDEGGWIEKEDNLSHRGNSWVSDDARVYGNARVHGNAWVSDDARVSGDALVSGNARVIGYARIGSW